MPATDYTLIHSGDAGSEALVIDAEVSGGAVYLDPTAFAQATGWTLKPEGFCKDDICVPAGTAIRADGHIDLQCFANLTSCPLVVDESEKALFLGAPATARGEALTSLQAPDFSLPDLTGTQHRLSDYRGMKVLLAAYASW